MQCGNCYCHVNINMQIRIFSAHKKSSSLLHTACQKGDTKTVHHLLKDRADVNLRDENRFTPLHIACKNDNSYVVESFLGKTAEVNSSTNDKIHNNQIRFLKEKSQTVQFIQRQEADVNI